jgi:tetratricopeptide (TPR) repeat protein
MVHIRKSGDVNQGNSRVAVAHTGAGDVVVLVGDAGARLSSSVLEVDAAAPSLASIRRELPGDIPEFTGRGAELETVIGMVRNGAGGGKPVPICVIEGMPGIGKTAFAVHAAHSLAEHFPDGQLFMRLHAHTAGRLPVEPADALSALLRETGMAPGDIPEDIDEKENEWRSRTAGKRVLLLFDDAASGQQIRPLLPGDGSCAVLITSRRRLEAFAGLELDGLEPDQAVELLARSSGRQDTDLEAAMELVSLAGWLPLAVSLLAGRLRSRPAWVAGDMIEELRAANDRSAKIHAADQSVSAAFDLSYNSLPASRKQFFRRLGLHPGTDIDIYSAAALSDVDLDHALQELDSLYTDHLIQEHGKGRFRFHDLLRDYARALAGTELPGEQDNALRRLCDYYLDAAQAADLQLGRRPAAQDATSPIPASFRREVSSRESASSWMEAERINLQAVIEDSATRGWSYYVASFAAAMAGFLQTSGRWVEAMDIHYKALAVARSDGDLAGEADALNDLGTNQYHGGSYDEAAASHRQARELYHALGNRLGEANALAGLGTVQYLAGNDGAALVSLVQALDLYRALGNQLGEANSLNRLGAVRLALGDSSEATAAQTAALELFQALGSKTGEASALYQLGCIQQDAGDDKRAVTMHMKALKLYGEAGDQLGEANTLSALSDTYISLGNDDLALHYAEKARDLYFIVGGGGIGQAEIDRIRDRIRRRLGFNA